MDARVNFTDEFKQKTKSKPKHTNFTAEPKLQRPTKAIIRYAGMEIELENYCATDIATIAKSLGE